MGNCALKGYYSSPPHHQGGAGAADHDHDHDQQQQQIMIKVFTTNGAIMELYAPITADQITSEFPGHALFRSPDPAHSDPLQQRDHLHPGHLYYLLPLSTAAASPSASDGTAPYRISMDDPRVEWKGSHPDKLRGRNHKGVWKVRLVINPEQLSEILSQDSRTEELIESVRAVAKCGGAATSVTTSSAGTCDSDESSVSSTCNFHWKAYVKNTTQPKGCVDS